MSSARERILTKVSAAMPEDSNRQQIVEQRIQQPPELIRPQINENQLIQFQDKLELGGGHLSKVESYSAAAALISDFLREQQLPLRLRLAPALKDMTWNPGLDIGYGKSDGDDLVSVTPAFCAIAESGSVVLLSSPDSPTSLNYLPDVHFVIVEVSQLVSHIEDAWTKLRQLNAVPRAVNVITGPSKTADVEQTLQIGAHGPRQLRVILIAPN